MTAVTQPRILTVSAGHVQTAEDRERSYGEIFGVLIQKIL